MRFAFLVSTAALASCISQNPGVLQGPLDAAFDSSVQKLLDQLAIPGAAVCVIDSGEVIHKGLYGVTDASTREPVAAHTRFQIASISKVFTAWAAMALAESGALELDAPIETFTGGYRLPNSEFDVAGVTAARLLSHTAGTSAWGFLGDPWTEAPLLPTRDYLERGGEDGAPLVQLEAEPGTRHRYSGGGFTVLQLAIEEASGASFSDFVERALFQPLGLEGAGFNGRRGLPAYSVGHDALGTPLPDDRYPALAAAGAYASLDDLIRFVEAHWPSATAPRGGGALAPESFDALFTPAAEANGTWALGYEVIPFAERDVEGLYGHTGDNPGYHSLLFVHPEHRDALIVLTNGDAGNTFRNLLLAQWCQMTGHGERFPARPVPVGLSLLGTLAREGADSARSEYFRRQREEANSFSFAPRQLDRLAGTLFSVGRPEDALLFLELNAMEHPDHPLPLESLADAYMQRERFSDARAICKRLLALEPDHEQAREWLASIAPGAIP